MSTTGNKITRPKTTSKIKLPKDSLAAVKETIKSIKTKRAAKKRPSSIVTSKSVALSEQYNEIIVSYTAELAILDDLLAYLKLSITNVVNGNTKKVNQSEFLATCREYNATLNSIIKLRSEIIEYKKQYLELNDEH